MRLSRGMGVGHKLQELGAAWPSLVLLLKRQRWEITSAQALETSLSNIARFYLKD